MKVYGWGGNRHNVLGLGKDRRPAGEESEYERSHGDVGTAPWKTEVPYPDLEVFNAQDPRHGVSDRKEQKSNRKQVRQA